MARRLKGTYSRPGLIKPGERYGRLTTVERLEPYGKTKKWLCLCDCGRTKAVPVSGFRSGDSQSCGCYHVERIRAVSTRHGRSGTKLYWTWKMMHTRCSNPKINTWPYYGGRGIRVCERWNDLETFCADMGEPPSPDHSIDRINNDGNYEPGNCRWATRLEQANNKRQRRKNG